MVRVLAFIEALGVTGPARNLLETSREVELHVATYRRQGASAIHQRGIDAFVDAFECRGIDVTVLEERHPLDPRLLRAVSRLIHRVTPDIVQTHNIKSHALVAAARWRGVRVPWIAFHHGYTQTDLKMRVYNRLDRHWLRHADAVIAPCDAFIGELTACGVDWLRTTVLHNAVDPRVALDRTAARQALGVDGRYLIVSIGRLSREKGHDVLIDACARLDALLRERLTVIIVGAGPARARLEARARSGRVPVRFEGFQPCVDQYYAAADLFVLPSRSEGSPNVLLEALAAGCPVIATRVGGVPEIVEHGVSASLVAPDRPVEIGDAIAHLLGDPAAAASIADGGRRAAARMTRPARNAKLLSIYHRVLETTAPTG